MEELMDIKKHISNYEHLNEEEKIIALERAYRTQLKTRGTDKTLKEIIERQMQEKEKRKPIER